MGVLSFIMSPIEPSVDAFQEHHLQRIIFSGCSKRPANEAAGSADPGAYAVRYVRSTHN
jgi:hypothetical protein